MFSIMRLVVILVLLALSWPLHAQDCVSGQDTPAVRTPGLAAAVNPNPSTVDIELPMPCGGKLILLPVCVPAQGYFGDLPLELGCKDCGRLNQGFMEGKHREAIAGSFTLNDLPGDWQFKLRKPAEDGESRCPTADDPSLTGFYYFIGKYEISNYQWKAVMDGECRDSDPQFSADDPRPRVGISWFEAVEFTRKFTEWLIKNKPEALPSFMLNRFGFIRLPTEAEWEYAARGGHRVTKAQLNNTEFFPLNGRPLADFAVYSEIEAAKPQEKLAWIGTKCPNPLGLYDTAGNAAEMVLEPFHFSLGYRLHGAAGGFLIKGGSFRKSRAEVMPGRREEQPFFLGDGAFRSADIGFRVVLSGIVTPQDRRDKIDQQWAQLNMQPPTNPEKGVSSERTIRIDQAEDPIAEIGRLVAVSGDAAEKENFLFLQGLLDQKSVLLRELQAEAIKGSIRSALLAAESLQDYATRRKVVINGNINLEKMKTETQSPALRESLERAIARARESLRMLDAALDHYAKFYLDRVRECQDYPAEVFEDQLEIISLELDLDEDFIRSLKGRLDIFAKHVALYKERGGDVSLIFIQNDILSNSPL